MFRLVKDEMGEDKKISTKEKKIMLKKARNYLGFLAMALLLALAAGGPQEKAYAEAGGYSIQELSGDTIRYSSARTLCRQYPCEELGGIYFLNGTKLAFYSLSGQTTVEAGEFPGLADVYEEGGTLYILENTDGGAVVEEYALAEQKVGKTVSLSLEQAEYIGVDSLGRLYIAAADGQGHSIHLLNADGAELSSEQLKNASYEFVGFDSKTGNFYFEGYINWVYWGYDHDMRAVMCGNVVGDQIQVSDKYISLLYQMYYNDHQKTAEFFADRYLAVQAYTNNYFEAYTSLLAVDSNRFDISGTSLPAVFNLERATEWDSVGIGALYRAASDSLIVSVGDGALTEYQIKDSSVLAEFTAQHPIFSLLWYGDSVAAIEKEGDAFYLEMIPWKASSSLSLSAEKTSLLVGEEAEIQILSDSMLDEAAVFTSSDSKVASVTQGRKVTALKAGTAVITASLPTGASASLSFQVSDNPAMKAPTLVTEAGKGAAASRRNLGQNDYTVWSYPMRSYLYEDADGSLVRVEAAEPKVLIEKLDKSSGALLSSSTVEMELPVFGGFYAGSDANYLVFGQNNPKEADIEVVRIVKYSRQWQRLGVASAVGANTYIPFDAGSLRMAETEKSLYVHTCHEMYGTEDGLHHQANMTFVVDKATMAMTDSYTDVMNIGYGYVSHSFNQFIQTDGKTVYRVDHGDANPRGIAITACSVDGKITDVSYNVPMEFDGGSGENYTGASIGGFELSENRCLIVGNQDAGGKKGAARNVFLAIADKALNHVNTVFLSNYSAGGSLSAGTPQLVKVSGTLFLVLWTETDDGSGETRGRMVLVNEDGTVCSDVVTTAECLSDCQPILCSDGNVRWYASDGKKTSLYAVNPYKLKAYDHAKHTWANEKVVKASVSKNGSIEKTCSKCGAKSRTVIYAAKYIKLSKATFTYNGKTQKPTVTLMDSKKKKLKNGTDYTLTYSGGCKDVGKYKVTAVFKGKYKGTHSSVITIRPKGVGVSKIEPGATSFRVKWKKQTVQTKGYELQYSTTGKFSKKNTKSVMLKNTTTAKKVTGVKRNKKYYVRIRTYKETAANGKKEKIYSAWSKTKWVKTKKK